jgi:hypothetical protein
VFHLPTPLEVLCASVMGWFRHEEPLSTTIVLSSSGREGEGKRKLPAGALVTIAAASDPLTLRLSLLPLDRHATTVVPSAAPSLDVRLVDTATLTEFLCARPERNYVIAARDGGHVFDATFDIPPAGTYMVSVRHKQLAAGGGNPPTDAACLSQIAGALAVVGPTAAVAVPTAVLPSEMFPGVDGAVSIAFNVTAEVLRAPSTAKPPEGTSGPELMVAIMAAPLPPDATTRSSACEGLMVAVGSAPVHVSSDAMDDPSTVRVTIPNVAVDLMSARQASLGSRHAICARLHDDGAGSARYAPVGVVTIAGASGARLSRVGSAAEHTPASPLAESTPVTTITLGSKYQLTVDGTALRSAYSSVLAGLAPCGAPLQRTVDLLVPDAVDDPKAEFSFSGNNVPLSSCVQVVVSASRIAHLRNDGTVSANKAELAFVPGARFDVSGFVTAQPAIGPHIIIRLGGVLLVPFNHSLTMPDTSERSPRQAASGSSSRNSCAAALVRQRFAFVLRRDILDTASIEREPSPILTHMLLRSSVQMSRSAARFEVSELTRDPATGLCAAVTLVDPQSPLVRWFLEQASPGSAASATSSARDPAAVSKSVEAGSQNSHSAIALVLENFESSDHRDVTVVAGMADDSQLTLAGPLGDVRFFDATSQYEVEVHSGTSLVQGGAYIARLRGLNLHRGGAGRLSFGQTEDDAPCNADGAPAWSEVSREWSVLVRCRGSSGTDDVTVRFHNSALTSDSWAVGSIRVVSSLRVSLLVRAAVSSGPQVPVAGDKYTLALQQSLESAPAGLYLANSAPRLRIAPLPLPGEPIASEAVEAQAITLQLEPFFPLPPTGPRDGIPRSGGANGRFTSRRPFVPKFGGVYGVSVESERGWVPATRVAVAGPLPASRHVRDDVVIRVPRASALPPNTLLLDALLPRYTAGAVALDLTPLDSWRVVVCPYGPEEGNSPTTGDDAFDCKRCTAVDDLRRGFVALQPASGQTIDCSLQTSEVAQLDGKESLDSHGSRVLCRVAVDTGARVSPRLLAEQPPGQYQVRLARRDSSTHSTHPQQQAQFLDTCTEALAVRIQLLEPAVRVLWNGVAPSAPHIAEAPASTSRHAPLRFANSQAAVPRLPPMMLASLASVTVELAEGDNEGHLPKNGGAEPGKETELPRIRVSSFPVELTPDWRLPDDACSRSNRAPDAVVSVVVEPHQRSRKPGAADPVLGFHHVGRVTVPSLTNYPFASNRTVLVVCSAADVGSEVGSRADGGLPWTLQAAAAPVGFVAPATLLPKGPVNPSAVLLERPLNALPPAGACQSLVVHGDAMDDRRKHLGHGAATPLDVASALDLCRAEVAFVPCRFLSPADGIRPDPVSDARWQSLHGAFASVVGGLTSTLDLDTSGVLVGLFPMDQGFASEDTPAVASGNVEAESHRRLSALVWRVPLRRDAAAHGGAARRDPSTRLSGSSSDFVWAPLQGCSALYFDNTVAVSRVDGPSSGSASPPPHSTHRDDRPPQHPMVLTSSVAGEFRPASSPTSWCTNALRLHLTSPITPARGIDLWFVPHAAVVGRGTLPGGDAIRAAVATGSIPTKLAPNLQRIDPLNVSWGSAAIDTVLVPVCEPGIVFGVFGTSGGRSADGLAVIHIGGLTGVWHDPFLRAFHVSVEGPWANPLTLYAAHMVQSSAPCKAPPVDASFTLYRTPFANLAGLGIGLGLSAALAPSVEAAQIRFHASPLTEVDVRLCLTWRIETSATAALRGGNGKRVEVLVKSVTPKTAPAFRLAQHIDIKSTTMDRLGTRGFFLFTSNALETNPATALGGGAGLTVAQNINTIAATRTSKLAVVLRTDSSDVAAVAVTIPRGSAHCPPQPPGGPRRPLPRLTSNAKHAMARGGEGSAATWLFSGAAPGLYCIYFERHGVALNAGLVTAPGPLHPLPSDGTTPTDERTGAILVAACSEQGGGHHAIAPLRARVVPPPQGAQAITRNWAPDFIFVPAPDAVSANAGATAGAAICSHGTPAPGSAVSVIDVAPEAAADFRSPSKERVGLGPRVPETDAVRIRVRGSVPGLYALCLRRQLLSEHLAILRELTIEDEQRQRQGDVASHSPVPKFFGFVQVHIQGAVSSLTQLAYEVSSIDAGSVAVVARGSPSFPVSFQRVADQQLSPDPQARTLCGIGRAEVHWAPDVGAVTHVVATASAAAIDQGLVVNAATAGGGFTITLRIEGTTSAAASDGLSGSAPSLLESAEVGGAFLAFLRACLEGSASSRGLKSMRLMLRARAASNATSSLKPAVSVPLSCAIARQTGPTRLNRRRHPLHDEDSGEEDAGDDFGRSPAAARRLRESDDDAKDGGRVGGPLFPAIVSQEGGIALAAVVLAVGLWMYRPRPAPPTDEDTAGRAAGQRVVEGVRPVRPPHASPPSKQEEDRQPRSTKRDSKRKYTKSALAAHGEPPPSRARASVASALTREKESLAVRPAAALTPAEGATLGTGEADAEQHRRRQRSRAAKTKFTPSPTVDQSPQQPMTLALPLATESDAVRPAEDTPAPQVASNVEADQDASDGVSAPETPTETDEELRSASRGRWDTDGNTSAPDAVLLVSPHSPPQPAHWQHSDSVALRTPEATDDAVQPRSTLAAADAAGSGGARERLLAGTVSLLDLASGVANFPSPPSNFERETEADSASLVGSSHGPATASSAELASAFADGLFDLLHCDIPSMMAMCAGGTLSSTRTAPSGFREHVVQRDVPGSCGGGANRSVASLSAALPLLRVGVLTSPSRPDYARVVWFFDPPTIDIRIGGDGQREASGGCGASSASRCSSDDRDTLIRLRVSATQELRSSTVDAIAQYQGRHHTTGRRAESRFADERPPGPCPACEVFVGVLCTVASEMPQALWAQRPAMESLWRDVLLPMPNWIESAVALGVFSRPSGPADRLVPRAVMGGLPPYKTAAPANPPISDQIMASAFARDLAALADAARRRMDSLHNMAWATARVHGPRNPLQ